MGSGAKFLCVSTLILLWLSGVESCGRGSISISNNGYKNILISVADRVEPNNQIIERIKAVFTEASAFLYEATRHRAYLQNITILLPNTWPPDPSYERVRDETADKSDIVVDLPDEGHGNRPFTIKTTPCGEPGYYTHLTPDFLLDEEVALAFGEYGRVLVHEWAHLRYGVFDEYPPENGGQHFYADIDGYIEGTRCSNALYGEMRTVDGRECDIVNGLPEPSCRFYDEENLSNRYASIMYRTTLDHLAYFCDNDTDDEVTVHNYRAPNQQNIMCGERSVWEVFRLHPDFANGVNPPVELNSTDPTFRIVRQIEKQTVLVLDVSGSMSGQRLTKLNQGCSTFISSIVRDGEGVGIVTFAATSTPKAPLTRVSNTTRDQLLNALPTNANGGTSIGAGLRAGLQVLNDAGIETGTLIVVSDGEENQRPFIDEVQPEVLEAGVTVHAIAITDAADSKLDALAQATGGLSFIYSENDNSNAINEAFRAIGELNSNPSERSYPLYSTSMQVGTTLVTERVVIDETLGRDSQFIFDYSSAQGLNINMRSPSGVLYDTSSPECEQDTTYRVYRFNFPGNSDTGAWHFNVTSLAGAQSVSITVASKSNTPGEYPIIAQSFWGSRNLDHVGPGQNPGRQTLHASVSKGYIPVLYADVVATVVPPQGASVDVPLKDDGAGADMIADDGIYSAYFTQLSGNGRYGVAVSVDNNEATIISPIRIIGQGVARGKERTNSLPDRPTGDFQRLANGGSFELTNYDSGVVYPPGRIQDFQVTEVVQEVKEITLIWTAVGAELDRGTLDSYDIRFGMDFDALRNNFNNQSAVTQDMVVNDFNLSSPQAPGAIERMRVVLPPSDGGIFHFAIKGLAGSNTGSISNVVSVTLRNIESRIRDFLVNDVVNEAREVTLSWTAAGAFGRSWNEYDIRYSLDFEGLRESFDNQSVVTQEMVVNEFNISAPQAPGAMEQMRIVLPHPDEYRFYVAIKGVSGDMSGPVSNIANATIQEIGMIHLQVIEVAQNQREVMLQWPSVAAQPDSRTLKTYNIRFSTNVDMLLEHFDNQSAVTQEMVVNDFNISAPQAPGAMEQMRIVLPDSDEFIFYFAIQGVADDFVGPLSNIAVADLDPGSDDLPLILGLSFAGVMLLVIGVIITVFYVFPKMEDKKRKRPKQPKDAETELEGVTNRGHEVESSQNAQL